MRIDSFDGEYRFLSNFWPVELEIGGVRYPTVEHAFQAMKTLDRAEREQVAAQPTPAAAKKAGRRVTLRADWNEARVSVMEHLLRMKFADAQLAELLRATGNAELVEGNWWNDRFWGVCRGEGANHLGRLLMKIRAEL